VFKKNCGQADRCLLFFPMYVVLSVDNPSDTFSYPHFNFTFICCNNRQIEVFNSFLFDFPNSFNGFGGRPLPLSSFLFYNIFVFDN
jgi:hypothetical protein